MDDYTSHKLKVLSLGAMVLVVFIHAQNEEVKFASGELTEPQGYWPNCGTSFLRNFRIPVLCIIRFHMAKHTCQIDPPLQNPGSALSFLVPFRIGPLLVLAINTLVPPLLHAGAYLPIFAIKTPGHITV